MVETGRKIWRESRSAPKARNRGAAGADGVGSGEGVSPSPVRCGLGSGLCPSAEFFLDFCLKMVHFGAF